MYIYTQVTVYMYLLTLYQLRGPRSNLASRSWFLTPFSNKMNQSSLQKWLIQGLGQGIYNLIPGHFVVQKVIKC